MKRIGCKGFCWLLTLLSLACLFGCAGEGSPTPEATQAAVTWDTLEFDRSMELLYADQFSVDYDQGGYAKLTIGDADTYLVVPEGAAVPSGLPEGVTVLEQHWTASTWWRPPPWTCSGSWTLWMPFACPVRMPPAGTSRRQSRLWRRGA